MYLQKVMSRKTWRLEGQGRKQQDPDTLVRGADLDLDPYPNVTDPQHCFFNNSKIPIIDFRMNSHHSYALTADNSVPDDFFLHTRNFVDIRFKSFGDNTWSIVLKLRFPSIYLPLLPSLLQGKLANCKIFRHGNLV